MSVNTKTVTGRRKLRFNTLDDLSADLDALEGKSLKVLGNWTPGRIFGHLAATMDCSIDGFPFQAPWYFRPLRLFKSKFLNMDSPAGFKLPPEAEGKMIPPSSISDAEGLALLRKAIERFKTETRRAPNPAFGLMTNDEWIKLHCRHAELHLGFIVPAE